MPIPIISVPASSVNANSFGVAVSTHIWPYPAVSATASALSLIFKGVSDLTSVTGVKSNSPSGSNFKFALLPAAS